MNSLLRGPCEYQNPTSNHTLLPGSHTTNLDTALARLLHSDRAAAPRDRGGSELMARFNGIEVPADGQKITVDGMKLNVPDRPIIPFIEGDGTGRDIWRASRSVFDAAVEKAYGGNRRVVWY